MAYIIAGNIRGPRGLVGPPGEMSFKPFPNTVMTSWIGLDKAAFHRAGNQTVVDTLSGRPVGAGPGTIEVLPVGSTTSIIWWREFGELGRVWKRTVSSTAAYASGWELIQTVKRAATSLTCGTATDLRTATDVGFAYPFRTAAQAYRWRLHIRNTNDRFATTQSGSLQFNEIAIGEMVRDANGNATGNYVASSGTVILTDTASSPTGAELVTDWVEHFPLQPNIDYVFRVGFTAASGQQVNYLQGGGWELTGGSAVVHNPTTAQTRVAKAPLDVWVELEVSADTPIFAYFGDSLTAGQDSTLPVYDSWPAQHAREHGAIPMFFAHAGATFAEWSDPAGIKFRKYSLPNYNNSNGRPTIARPDKLYVSMGSNTIFGSGKSLAETIADMNVSMPLIKAVTSPNVVYTTILPRHNPTDPQETVRKAYNDYLRDNVPWGGLMVYDAAAPITASNGNQLDPRWTASPTNIHLKTSGYARFAAAVG